VNPAIPLSIAFVFVLAATLTVPTRAVAVTRVTIESPVNGTDINARTVVVSGRAREPRTRDHVERWLIVNGRRVEIRVKRDGSYHREVILDVGRNTIIVKSRVSWSRRGNPEKRVRSARVTVTRTPIAGDDMGTLDLATASSSPTGAAACTGFCGESDDCITRVACFPLTATRVDCPAGSREWAGEGWGAWQCGFVMSVTLREESQQLHYGRYGCEGDWKPDPQRFVQAAAQMPARRFSINERRSPWVRQEVLDRNRYGLPRFDVERDLYIP
jgi:hypothetical protein